MHKWVVAALAAIVTLGLLGVGTASAASKTIKVGDTNNNSLSDVQNSCLNQGGVITSWTFIINQIRGPKPATINVTFQGVATPVSVAVGTQGGASNAHYTVNRPVGGVVTNATASIDSSWSGQFVLSHVTCVIPTANVTLTKTFEDGPFTHPPVAGSACFTIAPNTGTSASAQCSNTPQWNGLKVGSYTITETTVPAGYVAITPISFKVALDCTGVVGTCFVASVTPQTFDLGSQLDELKPGALSVVKKLGPAPGTAWSGGNVTFNVCAGQNVSAEDCEDDAVTTLTYPGSASSGDLDEGWYTVCEVVPNGYIPDSECLSVAVAAGETAAANELTFVNTLAIAGVKLTKTFESGPFTEAPAEGDACFTLAPNPGPDEAIQCSNTPEWTELTVGAYTISETTAPDGYLAIADIDFTVAIDCTGVVGVCVKADVDGSLTDLGEFNDSLQDGFLSVLKLLGGSNSTTWTDGSVFFYVCQNDDDDASPNTACNPNDGGYVETLEVTPTINPAESGALEEGYYTVCEAALAGYQADQQCKVVQVVAGETAEQNKVSFTNTPSVLSACSPGYWGKDFHFDSWPAAYSPTDLVTDVFGIDMDDMTLADALNLTGGGVNRALRIGTSALLDAAALNPGYTEIEVIDAVQDAVAAFEGGNATLGNSIIDELEAAWKPVENCPLN